MECLTVILLLFGTCNTVWSLYPPSNNCHEQLLLQQNLFQQEIQRLQQQIYFLQQQQSQGQVTSRTASLSSAPQNVNYDDFEYIPTDQGYKYSYRLPDGRRLEENVLTTGFRPDGHFRSVSKTTDFTPADVASKPKTNLKNRKLSPGSLRALAG